MTPENLICPVCGGKITKKAAEKRFLCENGHSYDIAKQAYVNLLLPQKRGTSLPGDDAGAFHSAELWYMFGTLSNCWRPFTEADYALSEKMVDAWTDFAKKANPGWKESGMNHYHETLDIE